MYINNNYTNNDKNKISNILNDDGNHDDQDKKLNDDNQNLQSPKFIFSQINNNNSNNNNIITSPNLTKKLNLLQLSKLPGLSDNVDISPPISPPLSDRTNRSNTSTSTSSSTSTSFSPRNHHSIIMNKIILPNPIVGLGSASDSSSPPSAISPRSINSSPQYPSPSLLSSSSPLSSPHSFSPHQILIDFSQSQQQSFKKHKSLPLPQSIIPSYYDSSGLPLPSQTKILSPRLNVQNQPNIISSTTITNSNSSKIYEGVKSKKETYQFEQIPLFIACFHNNILSLKKMINSGADMNFQCKNRGWTPLMFASQEGHIEIVNLILELKNIDINKKNFQGNTTLMIACYSSRKSIVEKLLQYGADATISNKEGTTPLMVSSAMGDIEIMKILIQSTNNSSSSANGNSSIVNMLDNRYYSALMYCQIYGYKANNNSNEYDGGLIGEIELENRKQCINLLIGYGSRIDNISKDEFDPLKLSIKHGPYDFVQYLLERLVDVYALLLTDSQGWSPLKLSIRYSPVLVIIMILKKIHLIFVHQQYQENSNHILSAKNKDNFFFEVLLFILQCNRDLEVFIRVYEYLNHYYQYLIIDKKNIEILLQVSKENHSKPFKDYILQHLVPTSNKILSSHHHLQNHHHHPQHTHHPQQRPINSFN